MIGLDTNVIIRYLTQDDSIQSPLSNKIISDSIDKGELLWISHITLAETVWVLERSYKISKVELMDIINILLQTQELVLENRDVVWHALQDYKDCKSVGFVDCLIGRQNISNDCVFTYTFDKKAVSELKTFQFIF